MQTDIQRTLEQSLLRAIAAEVMTITDVITSNTRIPGTLYFSGHLVQEPDAAYAYVSARFADHGYTAMLQEQGSQVILAAIPGKLVDNGSRLWLALLLFALTVASTIFVGWFQAENPSFGVAVAFSGSLLSILLAHELGHYLMARRYGVATSYPFFIPMPLSPIGTMGAFIAMKSPPPHRRALLHIAIAGPFAGMVVALPVLLIGLSLSHVSPLPEPPYFIEGNSLLYVLAKYLTFGAIFPANGIDVMIHPVAFAGWVGLLVTGLNLIPAGQLDGGHILSALVGAERAQYATWAIATLLLVAGFLWWSGWFVWAILIALFGRHRVTMLNELVPLTLPQKLLAIAGMVLFVLVFSPVPITVVQAMP